jgi:alpha-beta hydrolase superfamily lysophospholipase
VAHAVIRRTQSHFEGGRGRSLFQRAWLPATPERVLLVVHGFAEHSGRYEHFGTWFAGRGCAVCAYDQQGHGRSQGRRGHVRRYADLLDDLEISLGRVRREHPGLPAILVGHSMGGLAVASFLRERQPEVAGAVTSGAALAISEDLARARRPLARALRRIAPRLALNAGIDPHGLSRDPEVVRAYLEDPLIFQKATTSLIVETFDAIERTVDGADEVRVPMLVMHGEDDPICPAEASRHFYEKLTAAGKRLRVYPKLRHEIFNEPEQAEVFRDLLEWVVARKTESGGGGGEEP